MGPAVATLLLSALAGLDGYAVEPQASGRVESSAHAVVAAPGASRQQMATDVLPRLAVAVASHVLRLDLRWEPQLRVSRDVASGAASAALVQGGGARGRWEVRPEWNVTGAAHGAVRLVDLGGVSERPRLLDVRATTANVRYLDTGAFLGVEGRPSPLVAVGLTATASTTGGLGAADRVALPRLGELHVTGGVARDQTRIDVVRLEAGLGAARFDGGASASIATVGASWTRAWTRILRLRIAASGSRAHDPASSWFLPGGEAELAAGARLLGRPLRTALALRIGPIFDRYADTVAERYGVDATAVWDVTSRWSLESLVAAGGVRASLGYGAARGDLRVSWRLSPRVTLSAGAWNEWHHDPRLGVGATSSLWGASAAVAIAPLQR